MLTKLTMIIIIITIKRSDLGFVIHYIFGPYELWLVDGGDQYKLYCNWEMPIRGPFINQPDMQEWATQLLD